MASMLFQTQQGLLNINYLIILILISDSGKVITMGWYRNDNEPDKGINVESISSYMYITANLRSSSVS